MSAPATVDRTLTDQSTNQIMSSEFYIPDHDRQLTSIYERDMARRTTAEDDDFDLGEGEVEDESVDEDLWEDD